MKTRVKKNVVDLVSHANPWVCNDGFRWIEGRSGPRGSKGLFLVPASDVESIVQPPDNLYLRFFDLQPNQDSMLQFACQFGSLGVRPQHFHSEHTRIQHAESLADWLAAWDSFQPVLTLWLQAESGSSSAVRRYLASTHLGMVAIPHVMDDPILKRDTLRLARRVVVDEINRHLAPASITPRRGVRCYLPECKYSGPPPSVRFDVCVPVVWRADGRHGERPEITIQPNTLLGVIWLQFARYVCGERRVIRCQVCGKFMDVTDSPRPGARRMHPECSNRICQQRFRERHGKPPGV